MNYIKIINRTENSIEVELVNDDHSLSNLLKDILLEKKDKVVMASYDIEHPVLDPETGRHISNPKLIVKTTAGNNPEDVLKEALKEVINLCNKALESLTEWFMMKIHKKVQCTLIGVKRKDINSKGIYSILTKKMSER